MDVLADVASQNWSAVFDGVPVAYEQASDRRYDRVSILPDGPTRLPVTEAPD